MTKAAESASFDFTKMMPDFTVPGFDFEWVLTAQRKNVESVTAANRVAYEGAQAVMQRQGEILRQLVDQFSVATRQMVDAGTPQEKAAKQAEMARDAYERGVANARELGEMITRCNTEAFDILNKRFTENLDEARDMVLKAAKR